MPLAPDTCICLAKHEYSETSQILTLLGREKGIVRVLAKGAHRRTKAGASRFDGGVDLLDLGAAVFTDDARRDLATLTEWKLIEGHLELRRTLRGLRLALYAAELTSALIEPHDPHPRVFDQLARLLAELGSEKREEAMLAWQLDLLTETGHLPELMECVVCRKAVGQQERVVFSAKRGGLICKSCQGNETGGISLDGRLVRLVQSILRLPRVDGTPQRLPRLTRAQTDPLNRMLAEHVMYLLGKRLRTWDGVKSQN